MPRDLAELSFKPQYGRVRKNMGRYVKVLYECLLFVAAGTYMTSDV